MQFTQSISYPGTVDEVVAMYLTPAYLELRFGQFVVEGSQVVSVEGERVSFAGTVRPVVGGASLSPRYALRGTPPAPRMLPGGRGLFATQ